jgi:4-alpha-glucanotransferase
VSWWEGSASRRAAACPGNARQCARLLTDCRPEPRPTRPGLPHAVHEALLETLFASGSNTVILPIGDIFGWRDRINQPATVSDANWTWRLPWPSDRLSTERPRCTSAGSWPSGARDTVVSKRVSESWPRSLSA